MRKRVVVLYILTALVGTAMHFAYVRWPVPAVGLFCPVSESVWEHLKLLFWPFLAASCIQVRWARDRLAAWGGCLAALLLMPALLLAVYYPATAGFGVTGPAFDIGLYYAVLAVGFWAAARWRQGRATGFLVMPAALYGACLVLFSIAAPQLPIFLSAV